MSALDRDRLSRLTVVIPTYNRRKYLLRSLEYWNGSDCQVIIIDGSQSSLPEDTLLTLGSNIRYFHWELPLAERFCRVLEYVNTEYVILQGDDEFMLKQGISKCILELDENIDFSCIAGQCLGFRPRRNMIEGVSVYRGLNNHSVLDDSPRDRILHHMKHYVPSQIYGVARSKDWKLAFECFSKREFSVYGMGEIQVELCLNYAGKSKVIPYVTWIRSIGEAPPIRNTPSDPSMNVNNPFSDWWVDSKFADDKNQFIDYTAACLAKIAPMGRNELREMVIEGCDAYIKMARESKQGIGGKLRSFLPSALRQLLGDSRFFVGDLLGRRYSLVESGLCLEETGISVDIAALREIELGVASFHKRRIPEGCAAVS